MKGWCHSDKISDFFFLYKNSVVGFVCNECIRERDLPLDKCYFIPMYLEEDVESIHCHFPNVQMTFATALKQTLQSVFKNNMKSLKEIQLLFDEQLQIEQEKVTIKLLEKRYFSQNFISSSSVDDNKKVNLKYSTKEQDLINQFNQNNELTVAEQSIIISYSRQLNELNEGENANTKENINLLNEVQVVNTKINKSDHEIEVLEKNTQQVLTKVKKQIKQDNQLQEQKPSGCDIPLHGLYLMYRDKGFKVQLTDQNQDNLSIVEQIQQQLILTGQTESMKFVVFKADSYKDSSPEELLANCQLKSEMIQNLKKELSEALKIPKESVVILNFDTKSIKCEIKLPENSIEELQKNNIKIFEKLGTNSIIEVKSLLDHCQLGPSAFTPNHNMFWDESHKNLIEYRGSLPFMEDKQIIWKPQLYHFPVGYWGYGLNVGKWEKNGTKWFEANNSKDTWIVLYHGTKAKYVSSIMKEDSYIKPGEQNFHGNDVCRITRSTIQGGDAVNTYLADKVEESENYTDEYEIQGVTYRFVFQCRVNPCRVMSPSERPCYYTVQKDYAKEDIRPYRLLIKKC